MSDSETKKMVLEKFLEWLPSIQDKFQPYRPTPKRFIIDYKTKKAKIDYSLNLGTSEFRRNHQKIEIPKSKNYQITNFMDESFTNLLHEVKIDTTSNSYIIRPKDLPHHDLFLITLEGDMDPAGLNRLLYIQPARNKNNTRIYDRYWLDVMIRDVSHLEQIYEAVEVENVNIFIDVGIDKHFSTALPDAWRRKLNIIADFLRAGRGKDRETMRRAWTKFRKETSMSSRDIGLIFDDVIKNLQLKNYIKVDDPFCCGEIGQVDKRNYIPSNFSVEAVTQLSLKKPAANGYLQFEKERFKDEVKKRLEVL